MDLNLKTNVALLLIDIQKGLDDLKYYGGNRNNPDAEKNAASILKRFRELKWPIFHVRHSSTNPNSPLHATNPGFQIKDEVRPLAHEPIITKSVNSGFIGTDLESRLKTIGIEAVVIVGLTTNHCVSTTTRMAANLGFATYLISDATATFDLIGINGEKYHAHLMHQTALASLKDEFAEIVNTDCLLKNL